MGIETTPQDDKISVSKKETKAEEENKIEELRQKIKAAEEVLDSLIRELENIESSKLEWGPIFEKIDWYDGMIELGRLNKNLTEGEKKWRLPTVKELQAEFKKTNSTPAGFPVFYYGSSDEIPQSNDVYVVGMSDGKIQANGKKSANINIRLVR